MGLLITDGKIANYLHLNYSGSANIKGAGGVAAKSKTANNVVFKLGDLEFSEQMVTVMPDSQNLSFTEIKGVIGAELFSRSIVDI